MSKKSSTDTTEEQQGILEEVKNVLAGPCGHINRHFINIEGELTDLPCVLPKGHEGDHEADYLCYRPLDGSIKQARVISQAKASGKAITVVVGGKELIETIDRAYWSDGASVPVSEIQPDLEQLAMIRATKGAMLDASQAEFNAARAKLKA